MRRPVTVFNARADETTDKSRTEHMNIIVRYIDLLVDELNMPVVREDFVDFFGSRLLEWQSFGRHI